MPRTQTFICHACVFLSISTGCSSPPSETTLRAIGECYVESIEAFRESNDRLPFDVDELFDFRVHETRPKNTCDSDYEFSYVRIDHGETEFYRIQIGNILIDRRELKFDSRTNQWYYDS
jgi:hypothetical protein